MIKIDYPSEIQETESALRTLYQHASHVNIRERLEVLIWLKNGQVSTMKTATELKRRSKTWGNNLWKTYKNKGISGYCTLHYKPQESPLVNKKELSKQLSSNGFASIKEAREWIASTYQINYTENGLGNYFRHRKIKLKTTRPHHPKKDEKQRGSQERVFQEIKKPLKGEVFKNTEQIEAVINEQLKKLWEQPELVKPLTAWE